MIFYLQDSISFTEFRQCFPNTPQHYKQDNEIEIQHQFGFIDMCESLRISVKYCVYTFHMYGYNDEESFSKILVSLLYAETLIIVIKYLKSIWNVKYVLVKDV